MGFLLNDRKKTLSMVKDPRTQLWQRPGVQSEHGG